MDAGAIVVSSPLPLSSSVDSGIRNSKKGDENIDTSIFTLNLSEAEHDNVCFHLDKNSRWQDAARKMGYTMGYIKNIEVTAYKKRILPAKHLLSLWDDQGHTVTELFMVLYSLREFDAMEGIKSHVNSKYHRLLEHRRIKSQKWLYSSSSVENESTSKMVNQMPNMSFDPTEDNEDSTDVSSISGMLACAEKMAKSMSQVQYEDLEAATNNWNDANKLGSGGFGIVYKGIWVGLTVAIKKISYRGSSKKIQIQQSVNELKHLNSFRHDNVLPIYAYCINGSEQCLVYQYMAGGSLEYRLHSARVPLTFAQRVKIALGTANGLQFLHTLKDKPLIHGDIKPANILLDEHNGPKIGDFGLVRFGKRESMTVSSVFGTRAYLPKEYLEKREFSAKIDTYSYGIMLFEMFTALKAHDKRRNDAFLATHMRSVSQENAQQITLMDSRLNQAEVHVEMYMFLMKLAYRCTEENVDKRPTMKDVFVEFENALNFIS